MSDHLTQPAMRKPTKPHQDFPLTPHPSGRWCKKVRGVLRYFGPWADPDAALAKWLEQKDDLLAGRTPRPKGDGIDLRSVVNAFLAAKRALVDTGELRQSTWNEYHRACGQLIKSLGRHRLVSDIRPEDFALVRAHLADGLGLAELGKRIGIVRSVFRYGTENGLITSAVVFGSGFKKPSQKALRRHRAEAPPRMLEASELQRLLKAAGVQLRAMILLALNCGYGNTDLADLPTAAVDLKAGWVKFPRPKTGIMRKCPLWPDTTKAVKAALAERPEPKAMADAHRLFITSHGSAWVRHQPSQKSPAKLTGGDGIDPGKWTWIDGINLEFGKLLRECGLARPGVSFYSLRHVHRTVADEVNDRTAIDAIMGHAPASDDMGPLYVERIEEARLRRVTDHVRRWLWPPRRKGRSADAVSASCPNHAR